MPEKVYNCCMKKVILIMALIATGLSGVAQQEAHFSQYMFTPLFLNPATAGLGNKVQFTALHRSQWLGYQSSFGGGGAPSTQLVSASIPVYVLKGGMGATIVRDQLGPLTNFQVLGSYAWHYRVSKKATLSAGLEGGVYSQTIDGGLLRPIDLDDPKLAGLDGKVSQTKGDVGLGIWYQHDKFYVGGSVAHLASPKFDFGLAQANVLKPNYTLTAGYYYDINFDVKILVSGIFKTTVTKSTFDLNALAFYKEIMWGGLSYRQSEAVIAMVGFGLLQNNALKLGYAADIIVANRQAKTSTSHEIILRYEIPTAGTFKRPVRTPRFRY